MKKRYRGLRRLLISLTAVLILVGASGGGYAYYKYNTRPWYEKYQMIAHAMGGIEEQNYTNSLEAFQTNYEKGHRIFEIDLLETSDGVLVGRHKWKKNKLDGYSKKHIPTAEEFLNNPVYGGYTPLSLEDVLRLADEHPEIYIVTDTKVTEPDDVERVMTTMVQTAESAGQMDVLKDQFIIQIYNSEMYDIVEEWMEPENVLFTLYKTKQEDYAEAVLFCIENNIPVITVNWKRLDSELWQILNDAEMITAVHTVNEKEQADQLYESGVRCLYTDFLGPADFLEK